MPIPLLLHILWMLSAKALLHFVDFPCLRLQTLTPSDGGAEIATPDNAAPYCKGGHRETSFSVRVDAHYKFMFATGSIIWAAHRIKVFSSISFCISYSYVRQTKLASSLNWHTHSARFTEPPNRPCPHGNSAKPARGATRHTSQQSSEVVTEAAIAIPTPLKLSLLARAPACPCLRPRCCCCCCCCCRPAAIGTPYERRQNGWLHAELQATASATVEWWQTTFNSLIVQHFRFNRALTPLFDLQYKQKAIGTARGQWHTVLSGAALSGLAFSVALVIGSTSWPFSLASAV